MVQGHCLGFAGIQRPVQGDQYQAEKHLAENAPQHGAPVLKLHPPAHAEYGQVCSHRSISRYMAAIR